MKNIPSFEDFINESLNETMTFDDAVDRFTENPYGIGASRVVVMGKGSDRILVFRHSEGFDRDKTMAKLKTLGFPEKKMKKSMAEKGYEYRYELNLFEGVVNEEEINEGARVDTFPYKASHSKEPKGFGLWYFSFSKYGSDSFSPEKSMSYSDALVWAQQHAKKMNQRIIYVMG